MRRRTLIASAGAILGTSVGAAAYSQATVNRATTFTIVADSNANALLGLTDGTTNQITINGDQLEVSLENLNTNSTFVFGNPADTSTVDLSDASGNYAFAITNNDTAPHSLAVSYPNAKVTFDIFAPGGSSGTDWTMATKATTVNSGSTVSDGTIASMSASAEYRVVMTVDTTDVASGSASLDGTLKFTLGTA